jgi:Domain of unknown function (DUF4331)
MSSHRAAPEISKDPVADSTDLYAFVSPDRPNTVTLIANYIPLQAPAGGPNFYEFGDDVRYEIHIDNDGDGHADITYRFLFQTKLRDPETFLYNTGPITSLDSPNWNSRQVYSVHRFKDGHGKWLAKDLACPPCNIGPLSTPKYARLASAAVHDIGGGVKVFAGQRAEGFYVDLGAIFDLGDLRPFENLHAQYGMNVFSGPAPGVNAANHVNVHSIAIQVPTRDLVVKGASGESDPRSVIGVWTTASRQAASVFDVSQGKRVASGPFQQVSRLGNPLINEVIIALGDKDRWNALPPVQDKQFAHYYAKPGLAAALPALYPGVFPHLAALVASGKARADLEAILLTGIPSGIIPGFQNNTGSVLSDMLRLNTAIPPSSSPNILGLLGGDLAGFPNGRRVFDDIVAIELRAVAGVTYALVDKSYKPDAAASALTQFASPQEGSVPGPGRYLNTFPYLGDPLDGFDTPGS